MDDHTWKIIAQQKAWIDADVDLPASELTTLRLLKLVEEVGEVAEALIGKAGVNPRKGKTHTQQDVIDEVADVAITALVALATVAEDAREALAARLSAVYTRSLDHGAAPLPKAVFNHDYPAWLASLPKVLAATAVVATDADGKILLVKQPYRPEPLNWLVPGGGLGHDEPPRIGARRETAEEIALDLDPGPLVSVDWMPAADRPPVIVFTYDAGVLDAQQIGRIKLLDGELSDFGFFTLEQAAQMMPEPALRRVTAVLKSREDGGRFVELRGGWPAVDAEDGLIRHKVRPA